MNEILEIFREWGPSVVSAGAAIAISRTLKKHDDLIKKVEDHHVRLAIVETRCDERAGGGC